MDDQHDPEAQTAITAEAALIELRRVLKAGRLKKRLTMDQVRARSGLGRTVVSQAFSFSAPPPSGATVSALASALALDTDHLLHLVDVAAQTRSSPSMPAAGAGEDDATGAEQLGRLITDWDPHDLEVHPAADAPAPGSGGGRRWSARLPTYVPRPHDDELAALVSEVAMGHSRMAVLVGSSSTGKTRACWEAVQPLATQGWRLWHPFDPTRAEAALTDIERAGNRTVVWLNEAQHYFGASGGLGERIASAVHSLLTDPKRGPALVLGTLWPEYVNIYASLPEPGRSDPHTHVRALLSGRLIALPDSFDGTAIEDAQNSAAAGDLQLSHALQHARGGKLTQFLAGAPELLRRYESASPPVRALLHAAMDARRLGVGPQIPLGFLEHAAEDYLSDDEYDFLSDNWLEQALVDNARPVHGKLAPLRRKRHRSQGVATSYSQTHPSMSPYRLADYLEQHGRYERRLLCPPPSFWRAAHDHLGPADLVKVADGARQRYRTRWAYQLLQRAVESRHVPAIRELALFLEVLDPERSDSLYEQAVGAGDACAMTLLAHVRDMDMDIEGAEELYWRAADTGDGEAIELLSQRLDAYEAVQGIMRLYRERVDAGETQYLDYLVEWRKEAKSLEGVDWSSRQYQDGDYADVLVLLARWRAQVGDSKGAAWLYREGAEARGDITKEKVGPIERDIFLAISEGQPELRAWLNELRERGVSRKGAEPTILKVVDSGNAEALHWLYHNVSGRWPHFIDIWPHGLEPDGRPSAPW
ncbi:hypothetical protein [Streptomyces sp. NPDC056661]|uniref:hypothetical protein n=1 Tax=Streptomyces sp. NPDC056661 TaxID=3345898 RepID=UPI0036BAED2D